MTAVALLTAYSVAIVAASFFGIWVQSAVRLTHTRVQTAMSFIAGLVIGVAMYHLLPHSLERISGDHKIEVVVWWMIIGMVLMILLLRVFPIHQHEGTPDEHEHSADPEAGNRGTESLNWLGVAFGMGLHALTEGAALGATVLSWSGDDATIDLISFGMFLAIVVHKPLDAFFVLGMMRVARLSRRYAYGFSVGIAAVCPLGAFLTYWGIGLLGPAEGDAIGRALALGSGALVCISLSDLLPEIHFHQHDRIRLTMSFIVGLIVAYGLRYIEGGGPH